ncbi:MAG: barstar family protein [Chitinophagaceae bacterium]
MSNIHFLQTETKTILDSDTQVVYINGQNLANKNAFYDAISMGLQLPTYFGRNLDALADVLYDLESIQAKYTLILITHWELCLLEDIAFKNELLDVFRSSENEYLDFIFI